MLSLEGPRTGKGEERKGSRCVATETITRMWLWRKGVWGTLQLGVPELEFPEQMDRSMFQVRGLKLLFADQGPGWGAEEAQGCGLPIWGTWDGV